jgi:Protein of unknown function (DUF5818)
MRTASSLKRELLLGVALTAFVFVCAWAWGSPFVAVASNATPVQAQSQTQTQAQAATFRGTIERNGEQFVLREASGQIYRLDDPRDAQPFEGKAVTVTGKLDAGARMIHVERITPATA